MRVANSGSDVRCRNFNSLKCAALVPMLMLMAACASLRVGSDFDRSASFAGYHTFSLIARQHHGSTSPLVVQRARDAIQAELIRKGFSYTNEPGKSEFVVDVTIGAHERMEVESYPTPYGGPWYGVGPGWWGYPYWGSQVDVHMYREGTLGIDIFDAVTHKPVWHGWATKPLSKADMEQSEAPIRAAVAAVLERFPPR